MRKITLKLITTCFCAAILLCQSPAQTANVDLGSQRQTIRGFGGMNFPRWIPDLTTDQVDKAFGNGSGQIGMSILRVSVAPNSSYWNLELPTAQRAKSHGAIVLATPWSPPASMKTNNSTVQGELRTDAYDDYANYLNDFANYMSSNGASLYAISVQNEPDWLPEYESCGWSPTQLLNFARNNASAIQTRVLVSESLSFNKDYTDPILNDATARNNIDIVGGHLYGSGPSDYPLARNHGKEIWMTEHYTSSDVNANNWPDALGVGKEIHDCMVNNFNAYIWWYIRRSYGPIDENGNITKRGYVMSHFSKFARPGYYRVDASASPTSGVSVSAYRNNGTAVIVAINQNSSSRNVTFELQGDCVSSFTRYETTGNSNVNNRGAINAGSSLTASLPGNSITTFVGNIDGDCGNSGGSNNVWLEAECGSVGSLWNTPQSSTASNGQYVTIQSGNNSTGSAPSNSSGHITYHFDVSESGNYTLWARTRCPSPNDDSFWVRMDNGSWVMWNNIAPSTEWTWDDQQSYNLSTGSHTLTIAYREDGTDLDKIYLTNTGNTPTGTGSSAGNCSSESYNITVRARGTAGSEQITLAVGGNPVQSWTLGTSMNDYTASTADEGAITVEFTNDDGTNRDVQVDYIQVPGTTWQAENQSTNTGVWQNSSCGGSNSEWLHCGGYIEFSAYKKAPIFGNSEKKQTLYLYPNPASNELTIELPETPENKMEIQISTITGVQVKHVLINEQITNIDISELESGAYLITAKVNNKLITRKFFKK